MNGDTVYLNILKTSPKSKAFSVKGLLTVQQLISHRKEIYLHVIVVFTLALQNHISEVLNEAQLFFLRNRPQNDLIVIDTVCVTDMLKIS